MSYFHDQERQQIMVAAIAKLRKGREKGFLRGSTIDGREFEVAENIYETATEAWYQAVIPAVAGTFVLERSEDEAGGREYDRQTVIAWGITHEGRAKPITLEGTEVAGPIILHPDGRVEAAFEISFPNFEAFASARGGGTLAP